MHLRFLRVGVAAALFAAVSCSPSSGDGGSASPDPIVVPAIVSTIPAPFGANVPVTTLILARFSVPMDPATINLTYFRLMSPAGSVAGSVTLSVNGKEASYLTEDPLDEVTTYTVTCTKGMRSAAGQSLAADYSWSFMTVQSPPPPPPPVWEWGDLLELENGGIPLNYSGPKIVLDDSQNACAVWTQGPTGSRTVRVTRSVTGGSWSAPMSIPGSDGARSPLAAFLSSGEILVAWGVGEEIWESRATPSGDWSQPALADTADSDVTLQELFADASGNALLFYYEDNSVNYTDEFVVRLDSQDGWVPRESIPAWSLTKPSFAMDASGEVVVVWCGPSSGSIYDDERILSRRYTPSGGWSEVMVIDPNPNDLGTSEPTVCMDGTGAALAVWLRRVPVGVYPTNELFQSRMDPSTGTWSPPEAVPMAGTVAFDVWAALSPDGTSVIAWYGNGSRVRAVVEDENGSWSQPEIVDVYQLDGLPTARPYFDPDGRIRILGDDQNILWINEYTAATGWSGGTTLYSSSQYGTKDYSLAVDNEGRAAVAWKEYDAALSNDCDVWAIRYREP